MIVAQNKSERFNSLGESEIVKIFKESGEKIDFEKSREEIIEERKSFLRRDEKIKKKIITKDLLTRFIRRYCGVGMELNINKDGLYEVFVHEDKVEDLPEGYAYKGGAARFVLEKLLNSGKETEPRDFDLVYTGDPDKEDIGLSDSLAEKYMYDDYIQGKSVEVVEENYYKTRDFTINEIIYNGDSIVFTKECLLDMARGVIRMTESSKGQGDNNTRNLLAKAVRFLSNKLLKNIDVKLADEELMEFIGLDHFHMVLHLDRAIGQGHDVSKKYLKELYSRGQISEDLLAPQNAAKYFSENVSNFVFQYADVSKEVDIIDNWDEDSNKWSEYDDSRPMSSGFGKRA